MSTIEIYPEAKSGVTAVIVTYNPDLLVFADVVAAIFPQVQATIIIDNGSTVDVAGWITSLGKDNIQAIYLQENRGIAAAQNAGVHLAQQQGCDFILLMDQDSVPDEDMVTKLLFAYRSIAKDNTKKIAAIGPMFKDSKSGHISKHVRFKRFSIGRVDCKPADLAVPVDFLIASGSLVETNVFASVGYMDEGLFIDHVDTEWILRARAKGYHAWGHCDAAMVHSLGESRLRIWFIRWRDIPIHKPFRYYYVFRNSLLIRRRDYACLEWKRVEMIRLGQLFMFMAMFHPNRIQVLRMMFLGVFHGMKGIDGPLPK